jgi:predicted transcriptional regulator
MRGFGDLEAVIMQRVWDHAQPVTVRDLVDELQREREIAYTTVMTTMDNLHRKGWLARVKDGKAYVYTATASRAEYSARLMREALDDGGDPEVVLSHFVAAMGGDESQALAAVVRRLTGQAGRPDATGRPET